MNNYALGCAFTLDEVLENFPYKKLHFTCKDAEELIGDRHRNLLVYKIFKESVKLVISDIVNNNITFWLPLTGGKKCNLHMRRIDGENFKRKRRAGKMLDIDILKSNFTGYQLTLYMLGNRTPRMKSVYLNKYYRDLITNNTNNGMSYGDGKNDKYIKDYYQQIYKMFPSISKQDINKILNFSWKSLYLHNSYGGDTLISDKELWLYIGNLRIHPLDHFFYYIRKLCIRLRVLYRKRKIPWDGYYYFALTEQQYQEYLSQKNKMGRPRTHFKFKNIILYQIQDECRIKECGKRYIFKMPFKRNKKLKMFMPDFDAYNIELVDIRDPLKFKDILVWNNEYEFL